MTDAEDLARWTVDVSLRYPGALESLDADEHLEAFRELLLVACKALQRRAPYALALCGAARQEFTALPEGSRKAILAAEPIADLDAQGWRYKPAVPSGLPVEHEGFSLEELKKFGNRAVCMFQRLGHGAEQLTDLESAIVSAVDAALLGLIHDQPQAGNLLAVARLWAENLPQGRSRRWLLEREEGPAPDAGDHAI